LRPDNNPTHLVAQAENQALRSHFFDKTHFALDLESLCFSKEEDKWPRAKPTSPD